MLKIIVNIFYDPVKQLVDILNANNNVLVPVNGGSTLYNKNTGIDKIFFDVDCIDNISSHNNKLNEMTSIWWAHKSLDRIGNPEYIGFNHYRRFFNLNDLNDINHDIYIARPIRCLKSLMWQYGYYHSIDDITTSFNVMDFIYPGDGAEFKEYLKTHTDNFAPMNMFVMRKDLFCEWCEYIFPILLSLENVIDTTGRDNYQKRAICFICERIFGWWVFKKKQVNSIKELDIVEYLEFKDNDFNERGTY